ncbi:hypothetical protein KUG47_12045 [Falsochrobactrum sp. TDYN1]|uniref:Uncharacterized protein n=1 Tax=Falsochrobactrum tianjinense TaxID=2706015 RepID=A0A949UTV4_9HYPH|nr:hypothetical protein [Falsochrobactrum sp. TDYN1]
MTQGRVQFQRDRFKSLSQRLKEKKNCIVQQAGKSSSEEDRDFDWDEARNERRRQKYAEKRKAA